MDLWSNSLLFNECVKNSLNVRSTKVILMSKNYYRRIEYCTFSDHGSTRILFSLLHILLMHFR